MDSDHVGDRPALDDLARLMADLVRVLVDHLLVVGAGRVYRDASAVFERPLLAHVLSLTRGNQLRAARLLGVNRNTLRKRCAQLQIRTPRPARAGAGGRQPLAASPRP
jgi:DNA-binding protein Fis